MLSRGQKLSIYKLSALLSVVRWYNIFLLAVAQYLAVIFILSDPKNWLDTVLHFNLHLIVFASLFCIAGGFIINNFYDVEKDLINRPEQTLYQKQVKQATYLRLYFLFNTIGVLLAALVSFNVFLFFSGFVFLLWIYSHRLKKITFIGNVTAAVLSVMPFFAIFVYYHLEDLLIITYSSFILLVIFIREVIKDLEAQKGDVILGYNTMPVRWGVYRTKWIIVLVAASGIFPAVAIFYKTNFTGISWYILVGGIGVLISLGMLFLADKKKHYHYLNNIYKALIIAGIFGLMLFAI